jgi:RNA polymerase sigma-70 factor (sigma-E family)
VDRKQARAFEGFVTESGDALLRMATLLTADPDAAEDVYQETLHRLAMRWSRVDSPRAFCRRVMHNIVIDQARARKRRPRELFAVHDRGDPRGGDPVTAAELRPALLAALGTLTLQQRTVVVLRYFDDLSENEVAELLGVSPGTVKSTASRAVAQLRTQPGTTSVGWPWRSAGPPPRPESRTRPSRTRRRAPCSRRPSSTGTAPRAPTCTCR